jgi:hypothetical protein
MTDAADLVVRGVLADSHQGLRYRLGGVYSTSPPVETTFAVIQIIEVLKGSPVSQTPGQIEVADLGWPGMTATDIPSGEFLIFLYNDSSWRSRLGENPNPDQQTQYHYVRPNPFQTTFRDVNGTIVLVPGPKGWQNAFGPFPSQLDGTPYAQAVEMVRQAVAGSQ